MMTHSCSISTLQKLKQEDGYELKSETLFQETETKQSRKNHCAEILGQGLLLTKGSGDPQPRCIKGYKVLARESADGSAPKLCNCALSFRSAARRFLCPTITLYGSSRQRCRGRRMRRMIGRQELAKRKSCRLRTGVGLGSNLLPQWLRELKLVLLHPLTVCPEATYSMSLNKRFLHSKVMSGSEDDGVV